MSALIVYYSLTENTAFAAERIAEQTGAALLRLEPEKAYPDRGFKKFLWGGKSAVMAEEPRLRPYAFQAEQHDLIVFGFPVWASTVTPPIRTFVNENREALKGKRFCAFACQSGSGAEKALKKLETLLGKSLESQLVLIDPKDKPSEENERKIKAFCDALGRGGGDTP